MANTAELRAATRTEHGKSAVRRLRAAGRVPAVIYGHGERTRSISVDALELERLFSRISVENTIISLGIDGAAPVRVLVREVQSHPYRTGIAHVDFYQIHAGERVSVEVPVRLIGTPEGVRMGGVLDQILHDLSVRCLSDRIPEAIEADISALQIGDSLHVRDLVLPAGVEAELEGDRTVCAVVPPTVRALGEASEEPAGGVGGGVSPELIRRRGTEAE